MCCAIFYFNKVLCVHEGFLFIAELKNYNIMLAKEKKFINLKARICL